MEAIDNQEFPRRRLIAVAVAAGALALAVSQWPENDTTPEGYRLHTDVIATVFWVGETANRSNDFIANYDSYWTENWITAYGGVDSPIDRCGYRPCSFSPRENPFYVALPFGERGKTDQQLAVIPWRHQPTGMPLLKNRWVQVTSGGKTAYAQWEDVGPFGEADGDYVFGRQTPAEPRAGIDVSPAVADYLDIGGREKVDWRFVDESRVPLGPWTETITTSQSSYQ